MEQTKPEKSISKAEERKSMFSVYALSEVELPVASEKGYDNWVTYGDDNLFPMELIKAWLQSPIHNALVNGVVQMVTGDGITFDQKVVDVETWRKRVNRKGDTLEDLIGRTAFDLYLHGYYGWEIIWNKAKTKIAEIYHVPAEQIRSGKVNDETNEIEEYYTSWDWSQYRKKKFKPRRIKAFDITDRSEAKQLIFVKQYRPSQYYYSTPSYIGGMNWILLDNRIGEFHLNNIENGFFPSSVVQFFNGEPPQEEKARIERSFMQKFTGKKQAKIVFVYNNNQEQKVAFDTYEPANIERRFRDLMPEVAKNIMIAHRVPSPLLFGIRDAGGLGNNAEELESSSLLMNKMVVMPMQNIILQSLGQIFKINGWPVVATIETLQPSQWLEGKDDDAEADTDEEDDKFSKEDKRKVMPDALVKPTLAHLDSVGKTIEELEEDGWVLVVDEGELTEQGIKHKLRPDMFAVAPDVSDVEPEPSDPGFYIVRYQYRAGVGYAPIIDTTRDFCRHMMEVNAAKVYSVDEIEMLDNPDFGNYSIFEYKGSYNCRHRWARLVWFRVPGRGGQVPGHRKVAPDELPVHMRPVGDEQATKVNDRVQ